MASIFKRGRDKKNRYATYWIEYKDHLGKRRTRKGFTDKSLTEQLASKLEQEARLRKTGMIDPAEERLAEYGKAPIGLHLDAFAKHLQKNTPKHSSLTMTRVRRLVTETECETIRELNAERIQLYLRDLLDEGEIGHRTYNHYLQAIESFCNWLVSTRKLVGNPLVGMRRLNTEVDIRHKRRALRSEEFVKLVQSARESGEEIQCFDGDTRARIYILSYMTGLRRKELGSLTPRSFQLDDSPPKLTVEAACSKHRRKDVLPLHPELVTMLRDWLLGLEPDEFLFPLLERRRTWRMVKLDLERVGIPYENAEGIADFHAAGRHTHITELLRSGVSLVQAKELARHTDVKMTMRYAHIGIEDQAAAVARLPWKAPAEARPASQCSGGLETSRPQSGQHSSQYFCGPGGREGAAGGTGQDKGEESPETPNPCGSRGYDASCRSLATSDIQNVSVEAAGIEPASRDVSATASTCVVVSLNFAVPALVDLVRTRLDENFFNSECTRRDSKRSGFGD